MEVLSMIGSVVSMVFLVVVVLGCIGWLASTWDKWWLL